MFSGLFYLDGTISEPELKNHRYRNMHKFWLHSSVDSHKLKNTPIISSTHTKDQNISSAPETPFVPPPSCYSLPRGNSYADLQPHRSFLPVFDLCNKWNCRARTIIHCGLFGVWLCLLTIPLWDSFLLFQVDTELHSTCCVVFHCISITHLSIPVFLGMWVISSFTYFIFTVSTSFPWKWLF